MKRILFLLSIAFISMRPADKTRIVFFGDSITQMGVNKGGYIDRLREYVKGKGNSDKYEMIGAGIGGDKVYDLYLRMEQDVLEKKPDIVLIYVGINDVWHKTSGVGTDPVKYERFYTALIKKMKEKNIEVILCTPTVIGEMKAGANAQDADLDAYSDIIRKLAKTHGCKLVDLRKAFSDYEEANNNSNAESGILTTDRVHLNDKGSQLVADEMQKVLGL